MNNNTDNTQEPEELVISEQKDEQQYEMVDGVACPIDPMERLQCESCQ